MSLEINGWSIAVTVLTLIVGVLAAIPGVLALMKDTPESKRMREWLSQWPGLLFVLPAPIALFSIPVAGVVCLCSVLYFSIKAFRRRTSANLTLLVFAVLIGLMTAIVASVQIQEMVISKTKSRFESLNQRIEVLEKRLNAVSGQP